jgi:hypothetical protein
MATVAIAYVVRPRDGAGRAAGCYAVLAKYPLIAYAAAPGPLPPASAMWPRRALLLVGIYAAICLFETLDDVELRAMYIKPIRS